MRRRILFLSFTVSLMLLPSGVLYGQVEPDKGLSTEQLWRDAIHYFRIGRTEYGHAYLQAFLERKPKPLEVLQLSDKVPPAVSVLIKLQSDKELGPMALSVLKMIDEGWQQQRRDANRIATELDRLGVSPRAELDALQRLKESGEYAVPIMVQYLSDPTKRPLQGEIIDALVELGQCTLESLLVTVQHVDNETNLLIIEALARLDYPQALPYLKQLAENPKTLVSVRTAAAKAIEGICQRNPKYRVDANAGTMFYLLARRYYDHDSTVWPAAKSNELVGDIRADQPNIWLWKDGKPTAQPVPWEIYYELMTMRLTRRAIALDGSLSDALTLWLMANCRRELRLSEKLTDPLHDGAFPSCGYFFRCAGAGYCLSAVDQALAANDVAIVLQALSALTDVATGKDILKPIAGGQPIVKALHHPNQLVQLWSALALGFSAPKEVFAGVDRVVPLLGKTLSGPDKPLASLLIPSKETSAKLKEAAEKLGLTAAESADYETWLKDTQQRKAQIELVVLDYGLTTPSTRQIVTQLSRDALLRLVPVIVLVSDDQVKDAEMTLKGFAQVAIVPAAAAGQLLPERLAYLRRQLGRTTPDTAQSRQTALMAAKALYRLATLNLKNYKVQGACDHLAKTATSDDWELAYQCAQVMAQLDGAKAQQGLAAAALGRKDAAQQISMFAVLRTSIRRWGNKLTADQVDAVQQIVKTEAAKDLRESAAAVAGALNLPAEQARTVVLEKESFGK